MKSPAAEAAGLSAQDSLLGLQFPLPEHLVTQKALLLEHSKPMGKVIAPDGKAMEGHFNSGLINLVLDEIDSEPQHFYGHLNGGSPDEQISLLIYGIPLKQLDRLVPGQEYKVYWIETVANTAPFDDDRYRDFVVFRIEGN